MQSRRFTFSYDGNSIKLISNEEVNAKSFPTDPLQGYKGQAGFWIELRDTEGSPIYRKVTQNPISYGFETHSNEPGEPPHRWHKIDNPKGSFSLLVPNLENAASIVLMGPLYEPTQPLSLYFGAPAGEIATFNFKGAPSQGGD